MSDVNYLYGGATPLILAARNGHVETMKVLLELGSDPKAIDAGGRNALHNAAICGQESATKFLLGTKMFDIVAKDYGGNTPLDLAIIGLHSKSTFKEFGINNHDLDTIKPDVYRDIKEFLFTSEDKELDTYHDIMELYDMGISEAKGLDTISEDKEFDDLEMIGLNEGPLFEF